MNPLASLPAVAVTAALIHNVVFHFLLGSCPCTGATRRPGAALALGLAVTAVTTLTAPLTWLLTWTVLTPGAPLTSLVAGLFMSPDAAARVDLGVFTYLVTIFLILAAARAVEFLVRRLRPALDLPLLSANCVVLFVCLEAANHAACAPAGLWPLWRTLVYAVFSGLGFTLALVLLGSLQDRLDAADSPASLRGPGLLLIVAGILAMAFMGFTGLEKPYTPPPAPESAAVSQSRPASASAPAASEPAEPAEPTEQP